MTRFVDHLATAQSTLASLERRGVTPDDTAEVLFAVGHALVGIGERLPEPDVPDVPVVEFPEQIVDAARVYWQAVVDERAGAWQLADGTSNAALDQADAAVRKARAKLHTLLAQDAAEGEW